MADTAAQPGLRAGGKSVAKATLAPLILLALLYVVAVVVYSALARQSPIPLLLPDETIYGTLARRLADGDGVSIGDVFDAHSSLYPYVIAPAWNLASGSDAFEIAQTIGAAVLCLTVFPVWLLARRYVSPWLALIPALLVVSGSWMLTAAGLLTENAGLPLSAASLAATVAALARPGSRWGWAALGFAALAVCARLQLALLLPIMVAAIAIDCAREWTHWRARLVSHGAFAAVCGGLTLVGAIALLASPDTFLGVYDSLGKGPKVDDLSNAAKDQLTGLLAMSAVLPVVIVVAAAVRLESWRDERLGPLLAVTSAAVVLFLAQSAWALTTFLEGRPLPWHIQRYMEYALPLLLVAMTVVIACRRVPARELAVAGAVATLILLAAPGLRDVQEERGMFGLQERVNSILGSSAGVSLALVAALLVAVALFATTRLRPTAAVGVVSGAVLIVFAIQAQVLWPWQDKTTSGVARALPHSVSWIDDAKQGDVALFYVLSATHRVELTQFFNRDVDRLYVLPGSGAPRTSARVCRWTPTATGVVRWGGRCGSPPQHLLLDDDFSKILFYDQRVVAQEPGNGRLIAFAANPPSQPRLKAILRVPCSPPRPQTQLSGHGSLDRERSSCFPLMGGAFWLDDPSTLVLTFRGGRRAHRIGFSAPSRVDVIKPRVRTTLRLPIPQGTSSFDAQLDWRGRGPKFPELVAASLVGRNGTATSLLY